jgi:hypothetical protein
MELQPLSKEKNARARTIEPGKTPNVGRIVGVEYNQQGYMLSLLLELLRDFIRQYATIAPASEKIRPFGLSRSQHRNAVPRKASEIWSARQVIQARQRHTQEGLVEAQPLR